MQDSLTTLASPADNVRLKQRLFAAHNLMTVFARST
jgi:hypothetical protein